MFSDLFKKLGWTKPEPGKDYHKLWFMNKVFFPFIMDTADNLQELTSITWPKERGVITFLETDTGRIKSIEGLDEPTTYNNIPYTDAYNHFIKRLDEQKSRIDEMQKQIDELTAKCKAMWEYIQINCSTTPRR